MHGYKDETERRKDHSQEPVYFSDIRKYLGQDIYMYIQLRPKYSERHCFRQKSRYNILSKLFCIL